MNKLNGLQYLRGIASLLVVFYHGLNLFNRFDLAGWGKSMFSQGNIGVDIFFVLSGFVIAHSTKDKLNCTKTLFVFWMRRFWRVAPGYYIWTIVFILLLKKYDFFGSGIDQLISSFLFIPTHEKFPPLPVGWTLNFEMYFYLTFGLLMFLNQRWILILLFLIFPVVGFFTKFDIPLLDKLILNSHLAEFFTGVLLSFYYEKITLTKLTARRYFWLVVILFIVCYFNDFLGHFALRCISSALLVAAFIFYEKNGGLFLNKPFIFLGNISYSVYLCHIPILWYMPVLLKYKFGLSQLPNIALVDLLFIGQIILVAFFSYFFFERGFIRIGKVLERRYEFKEASY